MEIKNNNDKIPQLFGNFGKIGKFWNETYTPAGRVHQEIA